VATNRPLALVTGASAGLGEAFARAYAARGYDLALVARRAERLEALAGELKDKHGAASLVIPADLSVWEAHRPVIDAVEAAGRHVDALVNNAGFGVPRAFTSVTWDEQRDFLMTLAVTPCGLAYDVIPGMVARGRGSIINVASMAAFSPGVAGNTLYPAVKTMMVKFSQSLDAEYRAVGLKVTAVCPGFVRTEFAKAAGIHEIMEAENRMFWQTPEAVAETTLRANAQGRVVVVPGWHNKVAATLLQSLPQGLVRSVIGSASKKYVLDAKS
jgi:uncharacterized protein